MIAVALIAAFLCCLSMVNTINRRMHESATSNLLNTTQVIADTLKNYIERDYKSLDVVGTVYLRESAMTSDELLVFRNSMDLDWIGIVDAQGNGMDCYGNSYNIHDYPETHDWELLSNGFSNAYIGQLSGRLQITIWVPVYEQDTYMGAILGNVILTQYYSANVFTFYEGEGRTYLFDGADGSWILKSLGTDGTLTRTSDIYALLSASGNSSEDVAAFRQTVESGQSGFALLNFNGERAFLCFIPMPSSPNWYITTVIAKDTLLCEASEIQRMIRVVLTILCSTLAGAAIFLTFWLVRKTKITEVHYRQTLFANISANLDSAFLIYEKKHQTVAFVSDNFKRLLGLDHQWLSEDVTHLFDWCKIPQNDPQRIAFVKGCLDGLAVREVKIANELGENTRTLRFELIPADMDQELAVLTDITKDKDIQQSLIDAMKHAEAASNAKNDFLSAMSHDLRTPINGIVGMTAIAAAHLQDTNRVQDCLTKISESTAHLLSLINEVLDMSQIESGKIELSSEPFNIAALLQNVLNINYPGIQQKHHTVKVHIHLMEHEEVIGDPMRLTRITTNLISNAIKYTPNGGLVKLSLREKAPMLQGYGCYELTVEDNGIGMSPQFQKKIFQPFEREDDVRNRRIQGTGLGMAITKNMAELMMGNIQFESEKDKGSIFRVTINLRLQKSNQDSIEHLVGLPVLVVDDDVDSCQTVVDILQNIGMHGEWTDNGVSAVQMVIAKHEQRADYLAVILDWKMPDVDGLETARRIRSAIGNEVPLIILTAYEWSTIEAEATEAGVDAFLSKPIYRAKLLQKMTELTSGHFKHVDTPHALVPLESLPPNCRILLAEDNELNMEIAVELLQMLGVQTDWADNGAAAVERFAKSDAGTYRLILMDIQMPLMDGYSATRAIRALDHPDSRSIPIVAMTADAFKKDEQLAHEAGMNAHLAKPVSIERLTQILQRFLS